MSLLFVMQHCRVTLIIRRATGKWRIREADEGVSVDVSDAVFSEPVPVRLHAVGPRHHTTQQMGG